MLTYADVCQLNAPASVPVTQVQILTLLAATQAAGAAEQAAADRCTPRYCYPLSWYKSTNTDAEDSGSAATRDTSAKAGGFAHLSDSALRCRV
jgi:hypothetical protein